MEAQYQKKRRKKSHQFRFSGDNALLDLERLLAPLEKQSSVFALRSKRARQRTGHKHSEGIELGSATHRTFRHAICARRLHTDCTLHQIRILTQSIITGTLGSANLLLRRLTIGILRGDIWSV